MRKNTGAHLTGLVCLLLFGSGACALVYQVAWLRLLRLVFGGTTAASAAALAIFLGGLGFGGLWFGRRTDSSRNPLRLYGQLELGVAALAMISPLLIMFVRSVYLGIGGSTTLGTPGGTVLRLLLAAIVLGPATFLMGGTLPAAVRAVEAASDRSRAHVGLLYGANTLGAVVGTLWATFAALEWLGTNATVWSAAVINAAIGGAALVLAGAGDRESHVREDDGPVRSDNGDLPLLRDSAGPTAPVTFVLAAAAVVGGAFALMELVWYRMLAPLLGGSTYTFGIILAVALLGIGAGGLLYSAGDTRRSPTLVGLSMTAALEALFIAMPYALGDRIAVLALVLHPLAAFGFAPGVLGYALVTALVVLPTAIIAGYQFPLLIGLLGAGDERVGRHVGQAYACNTLGAIIGSLAGGFGLLPIMSAPGLWRATVFFLGGLAIAAAVVGRSRRSNGAAFVILVSFALCGDWTPGPTALWRHSGIGAGRQKTPQSANELHRMANDVRRGILWEVDGVESALALDRSDGYAFVIGGKSDGSALSDAPMQVMSGLVGAVLHPEPKRALVIGLGTGSTAGWLARVPSIERVDVLELEPAMRYVAEVCAPVNESVLDNPKVNLIIGDGREYLLTTGAQYDLIFSEPSNPYRAGVASLFTREFYEAAAAHLRADGMFSQWVQAYDIETSSLASIYATLGTVLPTIETWEMDRGGDMLLVARPENEGHNVARVRARVMTEPYRNALSFAWGVGDAEGFYSAFVGGPPLATALARDATAAVNTDDRTSLEFAFARSVGRGNLLRIDELRTLAKDLGCARPMPVQGDINWSVAEELNSVRRIAQHDMPAADVGTDSRGVRMLARRAYVGGRPGEALQRWFSQDGAPMSPMDLGMLGEILANAGDSRASQYIEMLRPEQPVEAEALTALWFFRAGEAATAAKHLGDAFRMYRTHPWAYRPLLGRAMDLAWHIAGTEPELAAGLSDALAEPFAVRAQDMKRISTRAAIAMLPALQSQCVDALAELEPNPLWDESFLEQRQQCYEREGSPLAERAAADLRRFRAAAPGRFPTAVASEPTAPQ